MRGEQRCERASVRLAECVTRSPRMCHGGAAGARRSCVGVGGLHGRRDDVIVRIPPELMVLAGECLCGAVARSVRRPLDGRQSNVLR